MITKPICGVGLHVHVHVLMRDEKEERKKQARSNKQTRQSNTAHVHSPILSRGLAVAEERTLLPTLEPCRNNGIIHMICIIIIDVHSICMHLHVHVQCRAAFREGGGGAGGGGH